MRGGAGRDFYSPRERTKNEISAIGERKSSVEESKSQDRTLNADLIYTTKFEAHVRNDSKDPKGRLVVGAMRLPPACGKRNHQNEFVGGALDGPSRRLHSKPRITCSTQELRKQYKSRGEKAKGGKESKKAVEKKQTTGGNNSLAKSNSHIQLPQISHS